MADETTNIEQQDSQELTPQQQGIQFEDILPWGTPGGDTGLSSRLKLKRNFEKIKAWIDSLDLSALMGDKFLSKKEDDAAEGLITFLKGLKVGNGTYGIGADGAAQLLSLVFNQILKSDGAIDGFEGGRGIWMDAVQGLIQTDGLEVRGFMRVMELVINRLQLMESDYSFTEGGDVEHIDYTGDGRLRLWMHKEHDRDFTPFYEGDIIYAEVNSLLPRGAAIPDGYTRTKHGAHYTVWMMVDEVDYTDNTLTVSLYASQEPDGDPIVPGGRNFTPYGTPIVGSDYPVTALTTEQAITAEAADSPVVLSVTGATLGEGGFDTNITVTRHGNVAGSADAAIRQRQQERQQSWVLSTTDQRLSYFWRVDQPIIRDDNYALCLGILPDLANLPRTRDRSMPSLYVNTIFYENMHHILYPSRIVKEDRGEWTDVPQVEYTGPSGTYTPDGTLTEEQQLLVGDGGTFTKGQTIIEPYHFQSLTRNVWLTSRLSPAWKSLTDLELLDKILEEWHLDLETSRVWHNGKLWECRSWGTAEEPLWGCTDWTAVAGDRAIYCEITSSAGSVFRNGNVDTILTMSVRYGQEEDIAPMLAYPQKTVTWKRMTGWDDDAKTFVETAADRSWTPTYNDSGRLSIVLLRSDMGSGWMTDYRLAQIVCTIGGDGAEPITAARRIM